MPQRLRETQAGDGRAVLGGRAELVRSVPGSDWLVRDRRGAGAPVSSHPIRVNGVQRVVSLAPAALILSLPLSLSPPSLILGAVNGILSLAPAALLREPRVARPLTSPYRLLTSPCPRDRSTHVPIPSRRSQTCLPIDPDDMDYDSDDDVDDEVHSERGRRKEREAEKRERLRREREDAWTMTRMTTSRCVETEGGSKQGRERARDREIYVDNEALPPSLAHTHTLPLSLSILIDF
jgi:hypothetical protein